MKILSVECSAGPASCAIIENGKIKSQSFVNAGLTHSQTLMQMIINTLDNSATKLADIDYITIAVGPGSFTGLRIGISAIKGIAAPHNIPCLPVSTLDGMAEAFSDRNCIVCAVMDARCNQFYNALFNIENGEITRLCDDRALLGNELLEDVKKLSESQNKPIIIVGDGAALFYKTACDIKNVKMASPSREYQNAVGVGYAALNCFEKGEVLSPDMLLPFYLLR